MNNQMISAILQARGINAQQAMQDSRAMVQQMVASGQISQQQVNALYSQAQHIQQQGMRGPLGMLLK